MVQALINWSIRLSAAVAVIYCIVTVTSNKFENLSTIEYSQKFYSMAEREEQLNCLAKNIYFEAATESFEGKVAVAQVTLNRVESGKFPSDVCDVVFQKTKFVNKIICQFSWNCVKGPKLVKTTPEYIESEMVAKKVLLENFRLPSLEKALYYHADYIKPNWKKPKIVKIGKHIFYGDNV